MSIEDPQIENETPAAKPTEVPAPTRGSRGELGVATSGLTIRQKWHQHLSLAPYVSLKEFARELAKNGDKIAKEWFANKRGAKNQARSEKALQRITAERTATKASRHKSAKK